MRRTCIALAAFGLLLVFGMDVEWALLLVLAVIGVRWLITSNTTRNVPAGVLAAKIAADMQARQDRIAGLRATSEELTGRLLPTHEETAEMNAAAIRLGSAPDDELAAAFDDELHRPRSI